MDVVLTRTLVSFFTLLLTKSVEEVFKELGKDGYVKVKGWWKKISGTDEEKMSRTVQLFKSDPETFKEAMAKVLEDYLSRHPDLCKEIDTQVPLITASGKVQYHTQISGGTFNAVQIGDHGTINQFFDREVKK